MELKGISHILGYLCLKDPIGPTSSSKHFSRADSDASPLHSLGGRRWNNDVSMMSDLWTLALNDVSMMSELWTLALNDVSMMSDLWILVLYCMAVHSILITI